VGFLKDRVYSENIGKYSLLKERIKQYCAEISNFLRKKNFSEEICKNVVNNLRFRLNYCIIKDGKHFSNIMKKNLVSH
jgi:hypothetical protein